MSDGAHVRGEPGRKRGRCADCAVFATMGAQLALNALRHIGKDIVAQSGNQMVDHLIDLRRGEGGRCVLLSGRRCRFQQHDQKRQYDRKLAHNVHSARGA